MLVSEGAPIRRELVRRQYGRLQPLEKFEQEKRGWTLDVLHIVRALDKQEFSLAEVYRYSDELQRLHPENFHVHDKIRQQLQRLRDMGLLKFLGRGSYFLKS